jgi:hypothetical protein
LPGDRIDVGVTSIDVRESWSAPEQMVNHANRFLPCGTLWCLGASSARFCVHLSQRLSAGIPGQCINVRKQGPAPPASSSGVRRLVQGPTGRIYVE